MQKVCPNFRLAKEHQKNTEPPLGRDPPVEKHGFTMTLCISVSEHIIVAFKLFWENGIGLGLGIIGCIMSFEQCRSFRFIGLKYTDTALDIFAFYQRFPLRA